MNQRPPASHYRVSTKQNVSPSVLWSVFFQAQNFLETQLLKSSWVRGIFGVSSLVQGVRKPPESLLLFFGVKYLVGVLPDVLKIAAYCPFQRLIDTALMVPGEWFRSPSRTLVLTPNRSPWHFRMSGLFSTTLAASVPFMVCPLARHWCDKPPFIHASYQRAH